MHFIKRLFLPVLMMLIIFTGGASTSAQQIGTTTLVSVGIAGESGGYFPQITPDGRHVIFIVPILNASLAYVYDRQENATHLVSISSSGVVPNGNIFDVAISDDGNMVAFLSDATNLVPNETNNSIDVFVHNRQTGQTTRGSVDSAGNQSNHETTQVEISGNGRYVSFSSLARNLVSNDTNWIYDIFVHDIQTGQTTRVSVDSAGNQVNGDSSASDISSDGRYVTFTSTASNLVANDTNDVADVFVHDRQTGQTTRVSVDSAGNQGNALSQYSTISGDGRYIAFLSEATNLIANDTNNSVDAFVYDLQTATTTRVSVSATGGQLTSGVGASFSNIYDQAPFISSNGQYVAYISASANIVSGDLDNWPDVFVHNRQTGQNFLASRTSTGANLGFGPAFSGYSVSNNGRFVAFATNENNVVPNDSDYDYDVFVYDSVANSSSSLTVGNTNILPGNANGSSTSVKISGDGRYAVFVSTAENLIPDMAWTGCKVYVHDHQTQSIRVASVTDTGEIRTIESSLGCTISSSDISDNGRYVVFRTTTPFVTGDTNNAHDIYLRDMVLNTTIRLPIQSEVFDLSGNGRYISFYSSATDLVPNDTNNQFDVFVYDIQTQTIARVSVDSAGNQATGGGSGSSRISPDGRFVLFTSAATNLVPNDTNGVADLFLHDTQTGETVAVSVDSEGNLGNFLTDLGNMSDDGRYIVFSSLATNLVPNDTNGKRDIFFHDRQTGETSRVSVGSLGAQSDDNSYDPNVSNDGNLILFLSYSDTFVVDRPSNTGTIFVHNRVSGHTIQIFRPQTGVTVIGNQSFSDNGDVVYFTSRVNSLVPGDLNGLVDIFRRELLPLPVEYPDTPILTAPVDMFITDSPSVDFSWEAVDGATGYQIQTSPDSNFETSPSGVITTNTYTSLFSTMGTRYWRVRAIMNGIYGEWSSVREFFINPLPAPTVISPQSSGYHYQTVFQWQPVEFALFYNLQIASNPDMTDAVSYSAGGATQYSRVLADGTYYWRVRASFGSNVGNWSEIRQFVKKASDIPPPIPTTPVNNATFPYSYIIFNIPYASGSSGMEIQVATDANFADIVWNPSITSISYMAPPYNYYFPMNQTYYWRVRSFVNSINSSTFVPGDIWSETYQFTITPFAPVNLLSPSDGLEQLSRSINFTWEAAETGRSPDSGTNYRIQVSQDQDFSTILHDQLRNNSNRLSWNRTLVHGTFYWRVRAEHGSFNVGNWSEVRQLTIINLNLNRGITSRISVSSDNQQGNDLSTGTDISTDGRYVVFISSANNLVPNDTNGRQDVFVRDRQTMQTTRISIDSLGNEGNQSSRDGSISDDGRYVVFTSSATNLVPNDTNAKEDVFVHDRQTGETRRISVSSTGVQANQDVTDPQIAGNGRYVVFESTATNLVPNDTNGVADVFLHDLQTGETRLASVNNSGVISNGTSSSPSISDDGRLVAFISNATNLSPNDTDTSNDIYIYDVQTSQIALASVSSEGTKSNGGSSRPMISGNGRYLVFSSLASNLDGAGIYSAIFLRDLQTNQTTRVSVNSQGEVTNGHSSNASVSNDGRYVVFQSSATNLMPDGTYTTRDVYRHDTITGQTIRISVSTNGIPSYESVFPNPLISGDGSFAMFSAEADMLEPSDTNGVRDVFVIQFKVAAPTLLLPADETFTNIPLINFSWAETLSATEYRLQIATDSAFANVIYDENLVNTTYTQTLSSNIYYWRVHGKNVLGDGAWSTIYQFEVSITENIVIDEQQLFNMAQSRLTHDMTFALFDITPTGIITTVQFSDGGVVTGTITMSITNGLVTIMVDGVSGGSADQQTALYEVMPAFIMAMFDEALPDEHRSLESLILTDVGISATVLMP